MWKRRERVSSNIGGRGSSADVRALFSLLLRVAILGALAGLTGSVVVAQDEEEFRPPLRFEGYPGAPEVSVVPRTQHLFFYPCDQCHAAMEPNPEIRPLNVMHVAEIDHGLGRLWCLNCHDLQNRNNLKTLLDEAVEFDEAHIVCGGCHANRHRDWAFGVHGKRVDTWQGERTQYNCTHCHDPHNPAIEPRAPSPPPPVRAGLKLERGEDHEVVHPWQQPEEQKK